MPIRQDAYCNSVLKKVLEHLDKFDHQHGNLGFHVRDVLNNNVDHSFNDLYFNLREKARILDGAVRKGSNPKTAKPSTGSGNFNFYNGLKSASEFKQPWIVDALRELFPGVCPDFLMRKIKPFGKVQCTHAKFGGTCKSGKHILPPGLQEVC